MAKSCKPGYYWCYTDKKCKKIPVGWHVGRGGVIEKDDEETKKKNGNGESSEGNGGENGGGMSEGTLHKWFKGSKSKDGKGGWVNVVTGGTCASDEPGEGTPKCVSSSKRASMSKKERLSAARRKKAADPGQQQKTGAAKPTYVSTDKKKVKEDIELTDAYGETFAVVKDVIETKPMESKAPPIESYETYDLEAMTEGKDKKGKGSGTKDACYHKVKSRYSVWPSAYASGALVKCRKVGAANWGNKSEEWVANNAAEYFVNEGINEEGMEIFIEELGIENFIELLEDLVKETKLHEAYALTGKKKVTKRLPKGTQPAKTTKKTISRGDRTIKAKSPSGAFKKRPAAQKAVETAKKQQPKKKSALDGVARAVLKGMDRHKKAMARAKSDIETTKKIASKIGKGAREFGKGFSSGVKTAGKAAKVAKKAVSEHSDWRSELFGEDCWDGYEKKGMKTMFGKRYPNCVKKKKTRKEETDPEEKRDEVCPYCSCDPCECEGVEIEEAVRIPAKTGNLMHVMTTWRGKNYSIKMFFPQAKRPTRSEVQVEIEKVYPGSKVRWMEVVPLKPGEQFLQVSEGAAWTKKEGKSEAGGLNEKGRKSYERENPGSDLKAPSKKVGNKRRASFCARMKGMKKKLTSSKTANDPDSRINKSLRAWNC